MVLTLKKISSVIICVVNVLSACGQKAEFHGQAAAWITSNYSGGFGLQTGLRYIPQILLKQPVGEKFILDGELSADSYLTYTLTPDSGGNFSPRVRLYRLWMRFSGERFEIRAGLQKINFGSASMLRPLMWFDRIDPRDPLKLTTGVYALEGKYYFKNNANIWLWVLYGNKSTKGWETIPSKYDRPELGGRLQLPVPKGEIAFSYHNRIAEFPDSWHLPASTGRTYPENRLGFDIKLDLGVGLWFESSVTHQKQNEMPPFIKAGTLGADYTLNIGNGLNISAEQMFYSTSDEFFSKGANTSFTGLSLGIPLTVITRVSAIMFYDWKNEGFYRFANLSFTFDNLAVNIIGFWNPVNFSLYNYSTGPNMFSGSGGQVLLIYNY